MTGDGVKSLHSPRGLGPDNLFGKHPPPPPRTCLQSISTSQATNVRETLKAHTK